MVDEYDDLEIGKTQSSAPQGRFPAGFKVDNTSVELYYEIDTFEESHIQTGWDIPREKWRGCVGGGGGIRLDDCLILN